MTRWEGELRAIVRRQGQVEWKVAKDTYVLFAWKTTRRDGLSSWRVILFVPAGMLSGKWVRTMIQQPGMTMNSKLTSSHSMHCRDPLCKNCTCNNKPSRSIELRLGANWLRLKTGMTAIGKAKAKAKAKTHAKGLKLTLEATTPTPSTTT